MKSLTFQVQELRELRIREAQEKGYGALIRTHHFNGTVTMIFERGELKYGLPNGARLER